MDRGNQVRAGIAQIRASDSIMRRLMDAVGPFTLRPGKRFKKCCLREGRFDGVEAGRSLLENEEKPTWF